MVLKITVYIRSIISFFSLSKPWIFGTFWWHFYFWPLFYFISIILRSANSDVILWGICTNFGIHGKRRLTAIQWYHIDVSAGRYRPGSGRGRNIASCTWIESFCDKFIFILLIMANNCIKLTLLTIRSPFFLLFEKKKQTHGVPLFRDLCDFCKFIISFDYLRIQALYCVPLIKHLTASLHGPRYYIYLHISRNTTA